MRLWVSWLKNGPDAPETIRKFMKEVETLGPNPYSFYLFFRSSRCPISCSSYLKVFTSKKHVYRNSRISSNHSYLIQHSQIIGPPYSCAHSSGATNSRKRRFVSQELVPNQHPVTPIGLESRYAIHSVFRMV